MHQCHQSTLHTLLEEIGGGAQWGGGGGGGEEIAGTYSHRVIV